MANKLDTQKENGVQEKNSDGEFVWEGVVETFKLDGHPKAKLAYAWIRGQGSGERRDDKFTVS